ncbi:MAG: hypothetical protein R2941_22240 [Desulfobacterales bacterium]
MARVTEYEASLKFLSEYLHRCHGQPPVIPIDEYDIAPFMPVTATGIMRK